MIWKSSKKSYYLGDSHSEILIAYLLCAKYLLSAGDAVMTAGGPGSYPLGPHSLAEEGHSYRRVTRMIA